MRSWMRDRRSLVDVLGDGHRQERAVDAAVVALLHLLDRDIDPAGQSPEDLGAVVRAADEFPVDGDGEHPLVVGEDPAVGVEDATTLGEQREPCAAWSCRPRPAGSPARRSAGTRAGRRRVRTAACRRARARRGGRRACQRPWRTCAACDRDVDVQHDVPVCMLQTCCGPCGVSARTGSSRLVTSSRARHTDAASRRQSWCRADGLRPLGSLHAQAPSGEGNEHQAQDGRGGGNDRHDHPQPVLERFGFADEQPHDRDREHARSRAESGEQRLEPPRAGRPRSVRGVRRRSRRSSSPSPSNPSGVPSARSNITPSTNPDERPALAATGDSGRRRHRHHDLDDDAVDLHVDEERALQREQHHPDGNDPNERTLDERREHQRTRPVTCRALVERPLTVRLRTTTCTARPARS